MRLSHALLIWAVSAAVMVVGLVHAQQPQIRPVPGATGGSTRVPLKRRVTTEAVPVAPRPTTPVAPTTPPAVPAPAPAPVAPAPPAPPAANPDVPPAGPAGPLRAFESGIDFRPTSPGALVTFNLEDADLPDLVRLISNITGKRFILPGTARAIKASVYAPTKVTAAEAYRAFLSILQLNGMTVIPAGRYLKIVESGGIESQPIPTYTPGEATPGDDRYLTRMHRLENVAAEDVAQLLTKFKSREGNVTAYAPTNTVIVTDLGSNIQRMMRIVEAIDVPRTGEQVWIEPIHYADATELAQRLQEIFPVGQVSAGASRAGAASTPGTPAEAPAAAGAVGARAGESRVTKILPDARTNSLIILATERAYLRMLDIIRELDRPIEGEGSIHVYYLQHSDAEEVASALTSLVSGATRRGAAGGGGAQASGAAPAASSTFEGSVQVTAYKQRNALLINSSIHDYAALRGIIDRMDVERRQVFIEAVIMDLSIQRSSSLGLSWHGGIPGVPSNDSISILGFNAQGSGLLTPISQESLTSLALGVRGPVSPEIQQSTGLSIPAFGVVLNALASSGDANVLATPHLIALDNEESEINIGENIPLQTSGIAAGIGNLAGLAGAQQGTAANQGIANLAGLGLGGLGGSVPRQDVGTKIKIKPHVNRNSEIRLEIQAEDSGKGATEGTLGVVSITKRTAKTQLVVRDQQTVVIGGLMRDAVSSSETKVPILGDIPLIGALFRRRERSTRKTNLLIFLTPYIIRSPVDLRSIFERKMRERQEFIDRYFVFGNQDYEPPIDYSRTRGMLAEMMSELRSVEEEQRLLRESARTRVPEHVPRAPVGGTPSEPVSSGGQAVISPTPTQEIPATSGPPGAPPPPPSAPPPTGGPPLGTGETGGTRD